MEDRNDPEADGPEARQPQSFDWPSEPMDFFGFDPNPLLNDRAALRDAFLRQLGSPVAHERHNCASQLVFCFRAGEVRDPITALLEDDTTVSPEVISVASGHDLPVAPRLRQLLAGPDGDVARAAAQALGDHPGAETRAALRAILEGHCPDAQTEVAHAAKIGIPGLEGLRARRHFDRVAESAAWSLSAMAGQDDLALLLRLLRDGDALVRCAVAACLMDSPFAARARGAVLEQAALEPPGIRSEMLDAVDAMDREAGLATA